MDKIPTPKYAIGDTFYTAGIEDAVVTMPCPDCLGTKEWRVTTPAGNELVTECARCSSRWSDNNLPSLKYRAFKAVVHLRTVGAIRVEWPHDASYSRHPVHYMASPNVGWVVYEDQAHDDRNAAMAEAERMVREKNIVAEAEPAALEAKRVSTLTFNDVRFDQFKNGLWDAWYAYRQLREAVDDLTDDKNEHLSVSEMRGSLDEAKRWSPGDRNLPALTAIVEMAIKAADDPGSAFVPLVANLPIGQRSALIKDCCNG